MAQFYLGLQNVVTRALAGSGDNIPFTASAFGDAANIRVSLNGEELDGDIYTVFFNSDGNGGFVNLIGEFNETDQVTIWRELPLSRKTAPKNYDTIDAQLLNGESNHLLGLIQELGERLGRAVSLPIESSVKGLVFPEPDPDKIIAFNADGDGLVATPFGATALMQISTDGEQYKNEAQASALSAEGSANTATAQAQQASGYRLASGNDADRASNAADRADTAADRADTAADRAEAVTIPQQIVDWDASSTYSIGSWASSEGSTYRAIQDSTNVLPPNTEYWQLFASKGDKGDKGDKGGYTGDIVLSSEGVLEGHSYITSLYTGSASWTASSAVSARGTHQLATLSDGRVLIHGGYDGSSYLSDAYVGTVDGNSITWVLVNQTNAPTGRLAHQLATLSDGRVLMHGGSPGGTVLSDAYVGTVDGNSITWVSLSQTNAPNARSSHQLATLSDGRVLIHGGYDGSSYRSDAYIGTVAGNTIDWVSVSQTNVPTSRSSHQLATLSDGRVLMHGGSPGGTVLSDAYIGTVDGNSITWVSVSQTNVPTSRSSHQLATLSDGRVLMHGGYHGGVRSDAYVGTVDGNSITWVSVSQTNAPTGMYRHQLATLSDGRVLMHGGYGGPGGNPVLSDAYLFSSNSSISVNVFKEIV